MWFGCGWCGRVVINLSGKCISRGGVGKRRVGGWRGENLAVWGLWLARGFFIWGSFVIVFFFFFFFFFFFHRYLSC